MRCHDERQDQQHQTERERQAKSPCAVYNATAVVRYAWSRGYCAHDHRRANLGDDLAEGRGDDGGEREARFARYRPGGPPRTSAQGLGGAADAGSTP